MSCINCDCETHAVHRHQPGKPVLASANLLSDSTSIDRLKKSSDYSKLYKVILHKNDEINRQPVSSPGPALQPVVNEISQRLHTFLATEESTMEERIRKYEEEQKTSFMQLKLKSQHEKMALINLIAKCQLVEQPCRVISSSPAHRQTRPFGQIHKTNTAHVTSKLPTPPTSPDTDVLFGMDDFDLDHDTREDGSYSDSEPESEDEGSVSSDSSMSGQRSLFSTSVPISMPNFSLSKQRETPKPTQNRDRVPDDIAASIKALAQSVHEDGTEIFGALPTRKKYSVTTMMPS